MKKIIEDVKNSGKIDKFLDTLTWYFGEKNVPTGFYRTIGRIEKQLENLNKNLIEADKSSTKLTTALNNLTKWGVIVAAIGVAVATLTLVFDIIKYYS